MRLLLSAFLSLAASALAAVPSAPVRPVLFEPTEQGGFVARGARHSLRLTSAGIDLSAPESPQLHLSFDGGKPALPQAVGASVSETHYFLDRDRSKWRTGVPNFERVRYPGIYPGIDLIVYATEGSFEYDLELAPHADPSRIHMRVQGTADLKVDSSGDLLLGSGGFRLRKPQVAQEGRPVKGSFRIASDRTVRFDLGPYDTAKPLLIDPVITFSTYLGGKWADLANDVFVDKEGNVYVAGYTVSDIFPGQVLFGAYPATRQTGFVTKYAPMVDGKSSLLYTILLGSNADLSFSLVNSVAVDSSGNVVLAGATNSGRFPLLNQVQSTVGGTLQCALKDGTGTSPCPDAFLTKFAPNGRTLIFSTLYGGSFTNQFLKVITDTDGGIYALGEAAGISDLDGTPNAIQRTVPASNQDLHLVRFSPAGQVVYATYLGGSGADLAGSIALESTGVVWIAGYTNSANLRTTADSYQPAFTAFGLSGYIARIDTALSGAAGLTYASFFGRSTGNTKTSKLFLDDTGQVVFCGSSMVGIPETTPTAMQSAPTGTTVPPGTNTSTFTSGDAFIARLNPRLVGKAQLTYSSYIGGSGSDIGIGCGLDQAGNFIVVGLTNSAAPFITLGTPLPYKDAGGLSNIFAIRIDPAVAGGRLESIQFGGVNSDTLYAMAIDKDRKYAYLAGITYSTVFPTTTNATQSTYGGDTLTVDGATVETGAGRGDAWITQLDLVAPQRVPTALGLVAGDYQFVNPGGVLSINPKVQMQDADGKPTPLTGYRVTYTGSNVTVGGTTIVTDSEGAAANIVRVVSEGPASLTANITGITTPYTFHFKAITGTLPTSAAIVSGSGQSGKPGTELAQPLVVEIRDATNAVLSRAGIPVQFKVNNVTVSDAVVETDAQGRASTRVTLGTKPGPMKITVIVGALPELTATFSTSSPLISAAGVVNAATFLGGSVAPGLIVTIFGENIGPSALVLGSGESGKFPVQLSETRVLFDGVPSPLVYVSAGQTSAIVPYSVAGKTSTQLVVEYQGNASSPATIPVVAALPGLFSSNSSGAGQGAILNQDNSVNSSTNPIGRRKIAVLFGTGEGTTDPQGVDGQVANSVYPKPNLPVRVRIGGVEAEVLYAGAAPTLVAGVLQINVVIPASTPDGNAIVEVFVGETKSPAIITVAVQGD